MRKFRRGFSFIELLTVMMIIGILAGVTFYALNNSRERSRDTKRKGDLNSVSSTLVLYYHDNDSFPGTSGTLYPSNNSGDWIPNTTPTYIQKLPSDPRQNTAAPASCDVTFVYCYRLNANGTFEIFAQLENADDSQIIGQPDAICKETPPFSRFNYCLKSPEL